MRPAARESSTVFDKGDRIEHVPAVLASLERLAKTFDRHRFGAVVTVVLVALLATLLLGLHFH